MTLPKPRRITQREPHEQARAFYGGDKLHPLPKARCDRRGQCAPGAMRAARVYARIAPTFALPRREMQFVDDLIPVRVAALQQQREPPCEQSILTAQNFQLWQIGRRQRGKPHKPFKCGYGIRIRQNRAARRDHDRVEYNRERLVRKAVCHRMRGVRIANHPDFDRVHANVADDCANLVNHHLRWNHVHRIDAQRILRGNGGHRRHRMAAKHRHRLDIRLNPSAATAVGTGDNQYAGCRAFGH